MTGPCIFRPLRFSSLNQRALMQISGAGLGIISTINTLFIVGFVSISRKQRPHEGPIKNRFGL